VKRQFSVVVEESILKEFDAKNGRGNRSAAVEAVMCDSLTSDKAKRIFTSKKYNVDKKKAKVNQDSV